VVSIPAGVALVLAAWTTPAKLAAAVYALSLAGLYGTSPGFHLGRWSAAARRRMDQANRAMIYVLIAGSYTPFALLALDRTWGVTILRVVWRSPSAGSPWSSCSTGPGGGDHAVPDARLAQGGDPAVAGGPPGDRQAALLIVGGVLYRVGAVVLNREHPDPARRSPATTRSGIPSPSPPALGSTGRPVRGRRHYC
jgi:hemolysin III